MTSTHLIAEYHFTPLRIYLLIVVKSRKETDRHSGMSVFDKILTTLEIAMHTPIKKIMKTPVLRRL